MEDDVLFEEAHEDSEEPSSNAVESLPVTLASEIRKEEAVDKPSIEVPLPCCRECRGDRRDGKRSCVCLIPSSTRRTPLGREGCVSCHCTGCHPEDVALKKERGEAFGDELNSRGKREREAPVLKNGCCKECMKAFSATRKSCLCQVPEGVRKSTMPPEGCRVCGCHGCHPESHLYAKRPRLSPPPYFDPYWDPRHPPSDYFPPRYSSREEYRDPPMWDRYSPRRGDRDHRDRDHRYERFDRYDPRYDARFDSRYDHRVDRYERGRDSKRDRETTAREEELRREEERRRRYDGRNGDRREDRGRERGERDRGERERGELTERDLRDRNSQKEKELRVEGLRHLNEQRRRPEDDYSDRRSDRAHSLKGDRSDRRDARDERSRDRD